MANYPDWVMKYKEKGTYIDCKNGTYYLYRAHSERVKGTNKVKRVYDGYVGKITEEDGLIPARDKVQSPVKTMEFGLSYSIICITSDVYSGMRRSYKSAANLYYVCAILNYIYHSENYGQLYRNSYLSFHFPLDIPADLDAGAISAIDRGVKMISDTMTKVWGEKNHNYQSLLRDQMLVSVNDKWYCPEIPENILSFTTAYGIDWRKAKWQK